MDKTMKRIYLAGPDVFFRNAKEHAKTIKDECTTRGLEGVFPLDAVLDNIKVPHLMAAQIFMANVRFINSCHGMLANMEAFRGPSMDVGTAWEMGYGYARGMPIAGYCSDTSTYKERFTALNMNDLHEVEDFGLIDNLMLTVPVRIFQSMQDAVQYLGKVLA